MVEKGQPPNWEHEPNAVLGSRAVEKRLHVHDLHASILHHLGFDHTRLTHRYDGCELRLTDVHGEIVREILA
jgi:Protein of unknown function (DUF1501)